MIVGSLLSIVPNDIGDHKTTQSAKIGCYYRESRRLRHPFNASQVDLLVLLNPASTGQSIERKKSRQAGHP